MKPAHTPALVAVSLGLVACVSVAGVGPAQARPDLDKVGAFEQPVYLTAPRGDRNRVFVVEKSGRIRVVVRGRTLGRPFLNLSGKVSSSSEQGLLSMAFSPRYDRDRTFYVNYTDRSGDTRIVAYRSKKSNPNRATASSARPVLRIDQPAANHNGGQLQFGPDGLLYIGMGDGGGAGDQDNNAQNRSSLLGKMLRIDPTPQGKRPYTIPTDNPFVGNSAWRPEIYSSGLRNPWRFSFDRDNGDLIIADVGQDEWEEIDHSPRGSAAGANFGWRVYEGPERFAPGTISNPTAPALAKSHQDGWCSVTGGYVVRDRRLGDLYGKYLYGDFCNSDIRSVTLSDGSASGDQATGMTISSLVSFGEDGRGRVYVLSLNGDVYRIRDI